MIRDLHTGIEATQLMALVMLVLSVSDPRAPLGGSALIVPFGWRAVFVAVTIVAVLAFILMALFLPETRPPEERVDVSVRNVLDGCRPIAARTGHFLGADLLVGGLGMASSSAFLASSSFVSIGHYGLSPTTFSFAFSINAFGFIGASQFAAWLGQRYGMGRVVIAAIDLRVLHHPSAWAEPRRRRQPAGDDGAAVPGLRRPRPGDSSTMVLALEEHGPIAGMASALGGTLQMVTGGIMIVIVSAFFDGTARPMVVAIALCALGALALAL